MTWENNFLTKIYLAMPEASDRGKANGRETTNQES